MNALEYDFKTEQYNQSQSITTNCIDMLFINAGTVTAYIDSLPLLPGQSLPINGNLGEVCTKQRQLVFANAAGTKLIYFVKRFYTN